MTNEQDLLENLKEKTISIINNYNSKKENRRLQPYSNFGEQGSIGENIYRTYNARWLDDSDSSQLVGFEYWKIKGEKGKICFDTEEIPFSEETTKIALSHLEKELSKIPPKNL